MVNGEWTMRKTLEGWSVVNHQLDQRDCVKGINSNLESAESDCDLFDGLISDYPYINHI